MNLNQWGVQFCTASVPTTVVMMVPMTFSTLNTFCQLIFISHRLNCLKRSHRTNGRRPKGKSNHGNHRNYVILQAKFYML